MHLRYKLVRDADPHAGPSAKFGSVEERVLHYNRSGRGLDVANLSNDHVEALPDGFFSSSEAKNRAWMTEDGPE